MSKWCIENVFLKILDHASYIPYRTGVLKAFKLFNFLYEIQPRLLRLCIRKRGNLNLHCTTGTDKTTALPLIPLPADSHPYGAGRQWMKLTWLRRLYNYHKYKKAFIYFVLTVIPAVIVAPKNTTIKSSTCNRASEIWYYNAWDWEQSLCNHYQSFHTCEYAKKCFLSCLVCSVSVKIFGGHVLVKKMGSRGYPEPIRIAQLNSFIKMISTKCKYQPLTHQNCFVFYRLLHRVSVPTHVFCVRW